MTGNTEVGWVPGISPCDGDFQEDAIGARRDLARPICATKFVDGLLDYLSSLLWVTGLVFIMNRQLLVGVIALAGIAERFFPKLTCQIKVASLLGQLCQRASSYPICLCWQRGSNRLLVELSGASVISSFLANTGHTKQFEPVLPLAFSVAEQRENSSG